MKKNLLLVVVCTLFVTSAYAQERGFGYGIKAGVNIAKVTNMGVDSKVGFTGGIFVDYRFSKVFALSADILYSGQGGDDTREKLKTDNSGKLIPREGTGFQNRPAARIRNGSQNRRYSGNRRM